MHFKKGSTQLLKKKLKDRKSNKN